MGTLKMKEATRPQSEEGIQYHIQCKPGDVARYVLFPGDPGRVPVIAELFDEAHEVAYHREYRTYTGKFKGIPVSTVSSGLGPSPLGVAIEELAAVGVDTFIRVGSTATIQEDIDIGDMIITSAAVRLEGTSKDYVRPEYPAVGSYEVTLALIQAAECLNIPYHVGITASTNTFYCGQGRPGFNGFWQGWMDNLVVDLQKARVLNFEMEAAALYTLTSLFGLRAGCVCTVFANRPRDELKVTGEKECAKVAVEAVRILKEMDEEKENSGKRYWYPGLRK